MQITEQWIGKVAGWKVLKAGRSLWKSGTVKQAEVNVDHSEVVGLVGRGEKPRRVRVLILGEHEVENKCTCMMTRRTGAICEHAVALMLCAILGESESSEWAPKKKEVAAAPAFEAEALRVEFSPNFPDHLANGISFRIHKEEREVTGHDLRLCAWVHQTGLREIPPMLALRGADVEGFLTALEMNPRLTAGEDSVHFVGASVRLPVRVEMDGDRVGFKTLQDDGVSYVHLGSTIGVWDVSQRIFAIPKLKQSTLNAGQVERLANGGDLFLPAKHVIRDFEIWEKVFDWGQFDLLANLRVMPAHVHFVLSVEGSLSKLTARLTARYPGGLKIVAGASTAEDSFPIQDRNSEGVWLMRSREEENTAMFQLRRCGFNQVSDGRWELDGEENVLDFLGGGMAELKKVWTIESGQRLATIQQSVVRVKPDIQIEGSGQDWLAFDYGFQTDDGKVIPRGMIEKMLRTGKRSGTTKNGKRVIISAFDAEMMGEVLKDVDPRQEAGKYYVSAHQGAYLKRVKQYYGTSLSVDSEACIKKLPVNIQETLREYQEEGIAWLYQRVKNESAALLADDMGLGKTLQTLALIYLLQQEERKPCLVVCPTSLLENWHDEADKFFPDFNVQIMHGSSRKEKFSSLMTHDIVITSYALIARDLELYKEIDFGAVVIDEASVIRNPDTHSAKALRSLQVERRIALTGTPVENALQDLWSIYEWMMPKYLGTKQDFIQRYVKPCSGSQPDLGTLKRLRLRVEPFMLRRTKQEVAKDLPPKIEQVVWCEPTTLQQSTYAELHRKGVEQVQDAAKLGGGRAKMQMLTVLLRLRQACCDVRLLGDELAGLPIHEVSAKLVRLLELVEEARLGGHRLLVFSQFTSMLALIKAALDENSVSYSYLDGSTSNRGEVVRQFQKDNGPTAFLISLKAGGYGLNLTAADMVVHFDPWWNPAVEAQATDRAYRIGQTKPVNVYKLVTRGTVEEKIIQLQQKKQALIGATVDEETMMTGLSSDEVDSILS